MTRNACLALLGLLALSACSEVVAPPETQYGSNPVLPAPTQYLIPPMRVPLMTGWGAGEAPTVPARLRIQAFATGFMHPRTVYTLPNGDVLVVESNGPKAPIYRPKDYLAGLVKGRAGAGAPGGNRITLLRDVDGDGKPDLRTTFLDHLNSPYGVISSMSPIPTRSSASATSPARRGSPSREWC
jgi:glucose/arabinose dehydrogenase